MHALDLSEQYEVFLSYHRADREQVLSFRDRLSRRGIRSFLDSEHLVAGVPWPKALERALLGVRTVLVFVGSGQNGQCLGEWQQREVGFALDRQTQANLHGENFAVIPILLPGARTELGFLFLNTWIDLREPAQEDSAISKIVAALQHVGEDSVQRPTVSVCPYRALEAFREEHSAFFCGREAFSESLLEQVTTRDFVALVGPSGSGKSSVVQAGLVPKLRRRRPPNAAWDVVSFRPGPEPFERLAQVLLPCLEPDADAIDRLKNGHKLASCLAEGSVRLVDVFESVLAKSNGTERLLIVIDQFEEIFSLSRPDQSRLFTNVLLDSLGRVAVTVLITLRGDFYGQAVGFDRRLSDMMQSSIVNVGPLTRGELRRTVEEPAAKVQLQFESGLVDRVLDHVERQPGSLPLLQFALTQLWQRRRGSEISHTAYEEIGGVSGALGQVAEQIYQTLDPARRSAAEGLFTRLVRIGRANQGGFDSRGPIGLDTLKAEEIAVLEPFLEARLLVLGSGHGDEQRSVELAHEALIHGWPQLTTWVDDQRDFLLWRERLGLQLEEWRRGHLQDELLLHGPALKAATKRVRQHTLELNAAERAFIAKSERRVRRGRFRVRLLIVFVLLVLAPIPAWHVLKRTNWFLVWLAPPAGASLAPYANQVSKATWIHALDVAGRLDGLNSRLTDFSTSDDQQWAVRWQAARMLAFSGRRTEALRFADHALGAHASKGLGYNPQQLLATSELLSEVGRTELAQKLAKEAALRFRADKSVHGAFGLATAAHALAAAGLSREAEIATSDAQAVFPGSAVPADKVGFDNLLALAYARLERADEAVKLLSGRHGWPLPLAVIQELADQGHIQEARLLALADEDPAGVAIVASALADRGDTDGARTLTASALAFLEKRELSGGNRDYERTWLYDRLVLRVASAREGVAMLRVRNAPDELSTFATVLVDNGIPDLACELAAELEAPALAAPPPDLRADELRRKLALVLSHCGQPSRALVLARRVGDAGIRLHALTHAAFGFADEGHEDQAQALVDEVNEHLPAISDAGMQANIWLARAEVFIRLGRYSKLLSDDTGNKVPAYVTTVIWTMILVDDARRRDASLSARFNRGPTRALGRYGIHWN